MLNGYLIPLVPIVDTDSGGDSVSIDYEAVESLNWDYVSSCIGIVPIVPTGDGGDMCSKGAIIPNGSHVPGGIIVGVGESATNADRGYIGSNGDAG